MYDAGKVSLGLAVFVVFFTSPLWYNLTVGERFDSESIHAEARKAGDKCVLPRQEMIAGHMELLDQWRDSVVREGNRIYKAPDGVEYRMSLSNTCLSCHTDKARFCDKCHGYSGVDLFCWDCHVDPGESK